MICPFSCATSQLSDDIAFRFGNQGWDKYPLTADTYADWLAGSSGDVTNIFLDYETFGEHFWKETGIFNFLSYLPPRAGETGRQDHPPHGGPAELPAGRHDRCPRYHLVG